ncbi:acetyl-coenzyme A transporter 1-like isoform X1, partial [Leptotrombidium deliense]
MEDVTDKVRRESFMIIETQPELLRRKGLKGDYGNLALLIFLYILQGIPLGIVVTIPLIMASNNVSYSLQAIFSFARYPYVMKLIWAPIIDSVYSKRFGRRKTWLVPAQYFLSGAMVLMSSYVDKLIGDKTHPPHIYLLTVSMFIIIFLTATQDIAVDAWAITLLARRNVHYASS